ncbi:phage holin family protein [Candidatus Absconditicoccus praedator]|uniref:phage holin family protein n=1 Tax=Candidatus Absconditicoccus praedator TaxID=2735562 RepID=UPI001E52A657|nr:phage holin family protein [Candidatus Absconditicoccus praedator]UFX83472.1 phage holin family protein [Candidatus Absconditicoccus praedator]
MINKILSSILINAFVIYVIARYIPELGFSIEPKSAITLELIFALGATFWVFDEVIKRLLKALVFPLMLLMSGLMSIIINIGIFYLYAYTVNDILPLEIEIVLGTFLQVVILSIVVSIANLLLKKL